MQNKLKIGLFGFGVVGESLWQVLQNNRSLNAEITKVCIRHPEKRRSAPPALFTTDATAILADDEINVVVELIDDAEAAWDIVSFALRRRMAVVSANKKMIAAHLPELLHLQKEFGVPLLYEAACCASIPVIRNLEEYYDNDLLKSVTGIVNGSTNYILTKIAEEQTSFAAALKDAQDKGFAESDPSLDVSGRDAANKLSILLTHAYGIIANPDELTYSGIAQIDARDSWYAREKGYVIKLVAHAHKLVNGSVAAFVLPQFTTGDNDLHHIRNEYNGVVIESGLADKQFFNGKGAGGFPTASAVISDLSALRYNYKYEYRKLYGAEQCRLTNDFLLHVYISAPSGTSIPGGNFERITEWWGNADRTYITGIISFTKLASADWWRRKGVSLIVLPNEIEAEVAPTKKSSRKLAII